jgi:transposase
MMTVDKDKNREQMQFFSMDQLVPKDHLLRLIDGAVDWSFIYDLVKEKYSEDQGRPSLDPVVLIKIPLIQYLYGIKSMRQTIRDIEVNMAYRWFLGLGIYDPVPHFTTFGKNYTRRFKDTDLFEQIFSHVLEECISHKLVDTSTVFIDATHIKACANNKKFINRAAKEEAMFYEAKLNAEIDKEREESGKKPLKKKEDDDDDGGPKGPEAQDGSLRAVLFCINIKGRSYRFARI